MNLLDNKDDFCLIHAGTRNIINLQDANCKQIYSLVGVESDLFDNKEELKILTDPSFVLPPYPRKMGISLPIHLQEIATELKTINFTNSSYDSPFVISIQIALDLGVKEILLLGFDGYDSNLKSNLSQENQDSQSQCTYLSLMQ